MNARETVLPPAPPTVADLARRAVRLLDDYAIARETALRLAAQGARCGFAHLELDAATQRAGAALYELANVLDGHGKVVWYARAILIDGGATDADAWSVELAQLAHAVPDDERTTEPPDDARDTEEGTGPEVAP